MAAKTDSSRVLKCVVRRGMFSDERVIIVNRPDGETESFFVPKSTVNESRSTVRVEIAKKNGAPGTLVALQTAEGEACVLVRSSDVEQG